MSEERPLVSAVINNHDYGRFLGQAIESVLSQTYPAERIELVVVDDGSTDDSRRVIESFGGRVKPVFQENRGQAAAINAGVQTASGEIVCLLDSDDWWRQDKITRVVESFCGNPDLGLVQHWCQEVDSLQRPLPGGMPQAPAVLRLEDFLNSRTYFTGTTGLCFRREVLRALGPIPDGITFCADEVLYYAVFLAPVGTIAEPLAWRRVHGANLYAERYRNPRRISELLRVRAIIHAELDKHLREKGVAFAPVEARRRKGEALQEELVMRRACGETARAWECWRALGRTWGGGYGLFKRASLLVAMASPSLYLWGVGLYARWQGLVSLRRSILRD